jgi:hypothetical protein
VETRSVSVRTVEETENAIAAKAAESHKTASKALPRWAGHALRRRCGNRSRN